MALVTVIGASVIMATGCDHSWGWAVCDHCQGAVTIVGPSGRLLAVATISGGCHLFWELWLLLGQW